MKALLIDDHALLRAGLRHLLSTLDRHAIVLEAGSVREANRLAAAEPGLDLVILDLRLPDGDGVSLLRKMKKSYKETTFVVLAGSEDPHLMRRCLQAGARSYLLKSLSAAALKKALAEALGPRPRP